MLCLWMMIVPRIDMHVFKAISTNGLLFIVFTVRRQAAWYERTDAVFHLSLILMYCTTVHTYSILFCAVLVIWTSIRGLLPDPSSHLQAVWRCCWWVVVQPSTQTLFLYMLPSSLNLVRWIFSEAAWCHAQCARVRNSGRLFLGDIGLYQATAERPSVLYSTCWKTWRDRRLRLSHQQGGITRVSTVYTVQGNAVLSGPDHEAYVPWLSSDHVFEPFICNRHVWHESPNSICGKEVFLSDNLF